MDNARDGSKGTGDSGHEPVELYGIIEIAIVLGVDRRKVAVWHGRGKLPAADFRASGRPFWKPETITPWIATHAHAQQTTAPEPAAGLAGVADQVDHVGQPPRPPQANSSATPSPPSSRSRRPAAPDQPGRSRSLARSPASGRRTPVDQDQGQGGGRDEDPYEVVRGGHGWTLTYRGRSIGTVRPAWSATGRSKRWQAYNPTGTRLDAHTYPTVRAAAVRVAQAHRQATDRRR